MRSSEEMISSRRPTSHSFVTPNSFEQWIWKDKDGRQDRTNIALNRERFSNSEKIDRVRRKISSSERLLTLFEDFQKKEQEKGSNIKDDSNIQENFINYLNESERFSYLSSDDKKNLLNLISKSELSTDEKIKTLDSMLWGKKASFIKSIVLQKNNWDKEELRKTLRTCFRTYDITKAVWYERRSSRNYLARKAGIENYNPIGPSWGKQNEQIRDWFLDKILEINEVHVKTKEFLKPNLKNLLDTLPVETGALISTTEALSALTDEQKKQLNNLNEERFRQFISVLSQKWDDLWKKYVDKLWASEVIWKDLWKCLILSSNDFYKENVIKLLANDPEKDPQEIQRKIDASDSDIQAHCDKLWQPIPEQWSLNRSLIKQKVEDEKLSQYVEKNASLKEKEKIQRLRDKHIQEKISIIKTFDLQEDLRTVRWEEYYQNIEQSYIQLYDKNFEPSQLKYQESSLWWTIKNKIFSNIENENLIFWDREIPKKIFNVWLNDKKYLDKIYPSQKNDKKNLLDENKEKSDSNNIEKKETSLYNDTNKIIKDEFKDRIVYFLWNCFDIKLDNESQETLLKSFNFEKKDKWEKENKWEMSLTWKDRNGKKIKIYYNTETWLVNVWKWINVNNNSDSVDIDKRDENNLSFVKWPRIDDFYDKAKNIHYSDILKDEKISSISDYSKEVSNQLKIFAPLENQWDFAKEELNKKFLINITLQDVADLIWIRDLIENGSIKELNSENKKLFSLLSRSFSTYNKQQLNDFRDALKFMTNYNEEVLSKQNLDRKSSQYIDDQLDDLEKSVSKNNYKDAKKITKILFEWLREEKNSWSFNGDILYKFFSSFLNNKESFSWDKNSIIDTRKFLTYYEDLSQEDKTDQEVDYMSTLNENMKDYLAEYWLKRDLSDNKNTA